MKCYEVLSLCFFVIAFVLGCNKNEGTYPNAGIIYNADGTHVKSSGAESETKKLTREQFNEKLENMKNDDLFQAALFYGKRGDYEESLAAYNKILERDKNYPDIYYNQGILYRDMGLKDEAICAFQTAVNQDPESAEAHYNLGYAYKNKGLYHESIGEYQKALELLSENNTKQKAFVHYNLGISYFYEGLIDEAIDEYKKSLVYKPASKDVHQKLGIAYKAKGWLDKAKNEFSIYHGSSEEVREEIP